MRLPKPRPFFAKILLVAVLGPPFTGWSAETPVDAAPRLGFAGKLPADTEMYFGSVNFKAQMDALKKSAFWKEISALVDDKTPAPSAGDKSMVALQKLWGDDWFIAGSAGMTGFMTWLKEFNHLYNEMNFRTLMTGATGGKAGLGGGVKGPDAFAEQFIQPLLQDPEQMERIQKIISGFEMPPLLIGFKVDHPADFAKQLLPTETLKQMPADKVTLGTMTTPSGEVFQTLTTDGSRLLSAAAKKDILDKLPADLPANAKTQIEKALTTFQAKKFSVGWGAVGDYLVFASGKTLDHVKFATAPGASVLSQAPLASLSPYLAKDLFALSFFAKSMVNASNDEQPLTPMLRGLVNGLKESSMFRDLAGTLDKRLDELSRRESAVFHRDVTDMATAFWWDHGVHMESYGGTRPRVFQTGKPLQFSRLLDQPGVVGAWDFVRDRDFEKAERAWGEEMISTLYSASQELVKVGLGGPQVSQQFAMFDQIGVPLLLKIYHAQLDLNDKALGDETAGVLDINGKMPALPGVPPESKGMKIPRYTTINQVMNRPEIAVAWKTIDDTINQAAGTFMGGGQPPGSGAAPGMVMPDPISSDKNGVTSYFFAIPFLSGDLLPCSAVNDHVLMLSSSKDAVESIAAELQKPVGQTVDGLVWRFDPGALMEYIVSFSQLAPNQTPANKREMKQITKWAKPFHAMQGHLFQEGDTPRISFTWEISDLVSFD